MRQSGQRSGPKGLRLGMWTAATALTLFVLLAPAAAWGAPSSSSPSSGPSLACHARITSVSGVSVRDLYHRIVVRGFCFGSHADLVKVSNFAPYNGTDTKNCGTGKSPPTFAITEWSSTSSHGNWSAGRFIATGGACPWGDSIGMTFSNWTPTMIVIAHGFGDALGTATQNSGAPWQMTPNTWCAVHVYNPANTLTPANFTLPLGSC